MTTATGAAVLHPTHPAALPAARASPGASRSRDCVRLVTLCAWRARCLSRAVRRNLRPRAIGSSPWTKEFDANRFHITQVLLPLRLGPVGLGGVNREKQRTVGA